MDDPLLGQNLSGYHIEKILARGEGETLYMARQVSVARKVALKVLSPEAARDRARVTAFVNRARLAGRLKSPGLVELHEVAQQGGFVFYSTEYLPGGSLAEWIASHGAIPWHVLIPLMHEVLEALEYAQGEGVVHGKIRPEHLLFTRDGRLKLLHLGLGDPEAEAKRPPESLSVHALVFLAPEQLRRGAVDARTDLYSLGCTWHCALSGRFPFGADTPAEVLSAKRLHRFVGLEELGIDAPPALIEIVERRLMALNPERRFGSFRELRASLEPVGEEASRRRQAPHSARRQRPPLWRRLSPPLQAGLASLPLVAAFVVALVYFASPGDGPPDEGTPRGPSRPLPSVPAQPIEEAKETPKEPFEPIPSPPPPPRSSLEEEIEMARAKLGEGRYREAAEHVAKAIETWPEERDRCEALLQDILVPARIELESTVERGEGHLALGELSKAEEALEALAALRPKLPPALSAEAAGKIEKLRERIDRGELVKAKDSLRGRLAELDFAGAAELIAALRALGRAPKEDEIAALEKDLEAAKALWKTIDAARLGAWKDLPGRFRTRYEGDGPASLERFRKEILESAVELFREDLGKAPFPHLFRGQGRLVEEGLVEVRYDFARAEELDDFVPSRPGEDPPEIEKGRFRISGEARVLRGNPFRDLLEVRLEAVKYDPDAPNIGLALWTQEGDRVAYDGRTRSSEGVQGTWDYLAFGFGYRPPEPLREYLVSRLSGARYVLPCHAILEGRRRFALHEDLRWDCIWGDNFLEGRLKDTLKVVLAYRPDRFAWSVNETALDAGMGSAALSALRSSTPPQLSGSVTLFTNGRTVEIESLTVTGRLDEAWSEAMLRAAAIRSLRASVPDVPWQEAESSRE
jgi:serine/threonine protein kinase